MYFKFLLRKVNALKHAAAKSYKQNMTAQQLKYMADWWSTAVQTKSHVC